MSLGDQNAYGFSTLTDDNEVVKTLASEVGDMT